MHVKGKQNEHVAFDSGTKWLKRATLKIKNNTPTKMIVRHACKLHKNGPYMIVEV